MRPLFGGAVTACFLLLTPGIGLLAAQDKSFLEQYAAEAAQNPEGVSLVLSTASGQSHFKPGEQIELELNATSSISQSYVFDGRDREFRKMYSLDKFHVDPPARDPWEDYFASIGGFGGSYSPSDHLLGEKAVTVSLDLNDWIRFERPGRYRVYIATRRLQRSLVSLPVVSNIIKIEILPRDPHWEAEIEHWAVGVLNSAAGDQERRDAIRALSFLGNEAAVEEMVRRLTVWAAAPPGCWMPGKLKGCWGCASPKIAGTKLLVIRKMFQGK